MVAAEIERDKAAEAASSAREEGSSNLSAPVNLPMRKTA